MKLVVAVQFDSGTGGAVAAAAGFDEWGDMEPLRTWTSAIAPLPRPARGEPDRRDVACVLQLLKDHALQPALIVIDGHVHLDAQETPGPGRHLFEALGGTVPVIGVSRAASSTLPAQFEVHREEDARPVFVTCAGIDLGAAKARVRNLHGRKRVPTLVKLAARLAKAG